MKKTDIKYSKKIHFMGIGGSAISGVALMAQRAGYEVSGCDIDTDTAYLGKVKNSVKKIFKGHNKNHLTNADLLVVSPSVLFGNKNHPEIKEAKKRKILKTWEEFLGEYLHKDKEVVCISGTHGKSTTTALAGLLFENAGFDPSVVIGAKVYEWEGNYRIGKGKIFITEADEFFDNYLSYSPDAIILNNIEFDHPDYFSSEKDVYKSFGKFLKKLVGKKILIVNQDSVGIKKLLSKLDKRFLNTVYISGYTLFDEPIVELKNSLKGKLLDANKEKTVFKVEGGKPSINGEYELNIPGEYNVSNALGVILLGSIYGFDRLLIKKTLENFKGIGRRLELIGKRSGVIIYDDYAHHPTAVKVTLAALRQKYPTNRIWTVVEPHSYSRTKFLLNKYKGVFENADKVVIGPIFKARDTETFGVTGASITKAANHKDIIYQKDVKKLLNLLKKDLKNGDVVIVMGAGKSFVWAREILKNL